MIVDSQESNPLHLVSVWLVDPPVGTRLVARVQGVNGRQRVLPVDREVSLSTTQLAMIVPGRSERVTKWVSAGVLPGGPGRDDDRTISAWALLPDGQQVPVPLTNVPQDGTIQVDLSEYPGARPTSSSSSTSLARGPKPASSAGLSPTKVVLVAGTLGLAYWLYRRSLVAAV